jgi:glycosyltransferase involved in cell wall biosynthesis
MRIGYLYGFRAYPPRGGNHLHAYQLIRHFQMAGHEVLTLGDDSVPGVRASPRDKSGAEGLSLAADLLYVRIDGNHLRHEPVIRSLIGGFSNPIVWEINAPANETLAFSWLGGPSSASGQPTRKADRLRRHIHALRKFPSIFAEERFRRRLARRAAAAICVSNALVRYAKEGLGIEYAIEIPNGSDSELNQPSGPRAVLPEKFQGRLKVLYAGSPIYPWQGLDTFAETICICRKANDPIAFVLLTNQPPGPLFAGDDVAVFTGVPHDEVQRYVRAADVGLAVHPQYFWSKWGFHGSSMKVFDYMACGLPVVASNVGQLAEVVEPGRNGWLFDNTPQGLRECLIDVGGSRSELARMGQEARRDVEMRFNWKEITRKTLVVFEDVLTAARRDLDE